MLTLYDFWESGNCYKVRLLLAQLGIEYRRVPVDILRGESRTDAFRRINPNARVPVLEWPDGRTLAESNAILWHLAERADWLPADPWIRAQTLQWLFFEQYSHEPCIAVPRFWHFTGETDQHADELPGLIERGKAALAVMDSQLERFPYFAGGTYGIADIALYAYTHVAPEGGFDLAPYEAVSAWLQRVAEQPGYVPLTDGAPV